MERAKIKHKKEKKNKKIIFILIILILIVGIIFYTFFNKNKAKVSKIGNNSTSQEIVDYILNISSYEVTVDVTVYSNKNNNQYRIKQIYEGPEKNWQEVLEPSNIKGVKIARDGNQLTLENTNLKLSSVLENYQYLAENCMDLSCFIEDYKKDEKATVKEENNQIILETQSQTQNPNIKYKTLKIDKETGNPIDLEIKGTNQKTTIYILYNEVKITSNQEENKLAFNIEMIAKEI